MDRPVVPRVATLLLLAGVAGCFSQRSFPLERYERLPAREANPPDSRQLASGPTRPVDPDPNATGAGAMLTEAPDRARQSAPLPTDENPRRAQAEPEPRGRAARAWLRIAHERFAPLLPPDDDTALLTDDLSAADGAPIDVFARFERDPDALHTLIENLSGLEDSAQATGPTASSDPPEPWPGFEDVWIPVRAGLSLYGRLGLARDGDGAPIRSNCVVILPGLFGDLHPVRTRDVGNALRAAGIHALAIESRGFGRTGARYPDVYYNFGVLEAGDLITVAEWLQDRPEVRATGLTGFCWGANTALVTAWESHRPAQHPSISARLAPFLRGRPAAPVFEAGFLAFSPVLRFEETIEQCYREWHVLENPVLAALQGTIRARLEDRHGESSGSLRRVIDLEFAASVLSYPDSVEDGLDYLRLLPHRGRPDHDKLARVTAPVLIVQAANDPLTPAQHVADLVAGLDNPNVAAVILPGGGHIGFAPYARDYFYSLLLNYFDPMRGPQPRPLPSGGRDDEPERDMASG